jgi:hypothetical protein
MLAQRGATCGAGRTSMSSFGCLAGRGLVVFVLPAQWRGVRADVMRAREKIGMAARAIRKLSSIHTATKFAIKPRRALASGIHTSQFHPHLNPYHKTFHTSANFTMSEIVHPTIKGMRWIFILWTTCIANTLFPLHADRHSQMAGSARSPTCGPVRP